MEIAGAEEVDGCPSDRFSEACTEEEREIKRDAREPGSAVRVDRASFDHDESFTSVVFKPKTSLIVFAKTCACVDERIGERDLRRGRKLDFIAKNSAGGKA